MNRNFTKTLLISFAMLIAGFVGIWKLSDFLTANQNKLPAGLEDSDLTFNGEKLAKYDIGFNGLLADWYWISALQYFGKKSIDGHGMRSINDFKALNAKQLYPMLDTSTTLDPKFVNVYSYGALILPAFDEEKAIKLAEKGIAGNPQEWRLFQHLAYIYWQKKDFKKASEIYAKGSEIEGSPAFMKMMSARLEAEGGSRDVARQIYRQMYDEATDDQTKKLAAAHLLQTESFEERDAIREVLKNFQSQNNRCAANWSEVFPLLRQLKLPPNNRSLRFAQNGSPLDPSNAQYVLNTTACEAQLDEKTTEILLN
jgi:tetratricopeptide (TPR) repeat protein